MTNSIRPSVMASLRVSGEAQVTLKPCGVWTVEGRYRAVCPGPKPDWCSRNDGGWLESEWLEGPAQESGRPVGKTRPVFTLHGETKSRPTGVRAFVVARKRGNSRGAKERRKVNEECPSSGKRNWAQCRSRLHRPEKPRRYDRGPNPSFGQTPC